MKEPYKWWGPGPLDCDSAIVEAAIKAAEQTIREAARRHALSAEEALDEAARLLTK